MPCAGKALQPVNPIWTRSGSIRTNSHAETRHKDEPSLHSGLVNVAALIVTGIGFVTTRSFFSGNIDCNTAAESLVGEFPEPPQSVTIISDVQGFVVIFIIFISDAIVCWRAWVLLYNDRFWKFTLALLMLGNIVINIVDASFDISRVDAELVDGQTIVLDWLAPAITLVVNLLATSLIGWKVWLHRQTLRAASRGTKTPVQKILLLLVESGIFVLAIQVIALIAEVGGTLSVSSSPSFGILLVVSISLFAAVACLYPVAVIILVKIDKSPMAETFHSQHQGASVRVE
ncbi:hypothetical protein BDP27DRAFT_1407197, partial [Rhodocollybia butyracea]